MTVVIAAHDGTGRHDREQLTSVSVDPLLVSSPHTAPEHSVSSTTVGSPSAPCTADKNTSPDFARPGAPFLDAHVVSADDDLGQRCRSSMPRRRRACRRSHRGRRRSRLLRRRRCHHRCTRLPSRHVRDLTKTTRPHLRNASIGMREDMTDLRSRPRRSAHTDPWRWRIDPSHSSVAFEARHMLTRMRGRFRNSTARFTSVNRWKRHSLESTRRASTQPTDLQTTRSAAPTSSTLPTTLT